MERLAFDNPFIKYTCLSSPRPNEKFFNLYKRGRLVDDALGVLQLLPDGKWLFLPGSAHYDYEDVSFIGEAIIAILTGSYV